MSERPSKCEIQSLRSTLGKLVEDVREAGRHQFAGVRGKVEGQARSFADQGNVMIHDRPIAVVAGAFVAGMVLGSLLLRALLSR